MSLLSHLPVLLKEVMEALHPKEGGIYVDGTFGGGGYTRALLEMDACSVIAIDRDAQAIERGKELKSLYPNRLTLIHGCFGQIDTLLQTQGIEKVDGFVFDLGLSSYQLDDPVRGFSFSREGPLDMRMGQEGVSVEEVINTYPEQELADILWQFGQEKRSRAIASAIVRARLQAPLKTTKELAQVIQKACGGGRRSHHPATLTFQALRIFVNEEMEELDRALKICPGLLKAGGRLVMVTFHSLEDRQVKHALKDLVQPRSAQGINPYQEHLTSEYEWVYRKGIKPQSEEIEGNPRSRSARVRAIRRKEVV